MATWDETKSLLSSANTWNNWSFGIGAGLSLAGGLYSIYSNNKISKYQQRIVKAQAQVEANQYAAQSVGYQMEAQRLAQSQGMQEYETIRQQQAYIEDAKVNMATSGATMEGSNAYMIAAQQQEFDRQNAYTDLQNRREQANYMVASNQALSNAQAAIEGGNMQASLIGSQRKYSTATGLINMGSGLLNLTTGWYDRYTRINYNTPF